MSDILFVVLATLAAFLIFAAVRIVEVERKRRDILSEAWRKEQAKKEDEDTHTWPGPGAVV